MENETKRKHRTRQEIIESKIATNEERIRTYKMKIAELERANEELRKPQITMGDVIKAIKEKNLTLDEVMRSISEMGKDEKESE